MHVVIRYLFVALLKMSFFPSEFISSDCIYHFCEGHDATQHAAFGEAAHIAITLRLHEESAYDGLDPIECEVRKRIFWLLFGGGHHISLSPNNAAHFLLPLSRQIHVNTSRPADMSS